MNSLLQRLFGHLAVRARLWVALLLLAGMVVVPIPLLVRAPGLLLARQEAVSGRLGETERSLLAASVHIATSRAKLLEYLDDRVPVVDGVLVEAGEGLIHLDAAARVVPDGILVAGEAGSGRELGAEIRDLRIALGDYETLIVYLQSARLPDDAASVAEQALGVANRLVMTAEGLVVANKDARLIAEAALRAEARRWTLQAGLGYTLGSVLALGFAFALFSSIVRSVDRLRTGAARLSAGPFGTVAPAPVSLEGEDELAFVAGALNTLSAGIARSHQLLESRVEERTTALGQRIKQLQAMIEVAHTVADLSTLVDASRQFIDLNVLLQHIVDIIQRRFSLYYVGLFLVEEGTSAATPFAPTGSILLRAGTGEAGARMVAREHRLSPGEGMVGWSVANGRARVALEVETDLVRVMNPELPATRSEAAIPLRVAIERDGLAPSIATITGEERAGATRRAVIGALTIQDDKPGAFDDETIEVLQVMADLLAVLIGNARRYRDVHNALEAMHRSYGQETREGWLRVLGARPAGTGYLATGSGTLLAASSTWDQRMRRAVAARQTLDADGALVLPIAARGQTIGAVRLQHAAPADGNGRRSEGGMEQPHARAGSPAGEQAAARIWSAKEIALVQTIVEQLGMALDSARLYEDTQNAAMLEQMIGEVTSRVRAEVEIEAVLERALAELGQALGADRGAAFLSLGDDSPGTDGAEDAHE